MSFSISIQAPSKSEAVTRATEALTQQLNSQPAHAHDKAAILSSVKAFIDAVEDNQTQDVNISAYGHANGWWSENVLQHINETSMAIKVWLTARRAQEPAPQPPAVASTEPQIVADAAAVVAAVAVAADDIAAATQQPPANPPADAGTAVAP